MRITLALILAALAAFGLTLTGSFHLDDYALFRDPAITSPGGWFELWRWSQTRPLTWLTYWLNFQLGGENPGGYHAVNLVLHAAAAAALYHAVRPRLSTRTAGFAAALFAVHPMQTESVAYVFARGTLLSALLCFASLGCWLRGRRWYAVALFAAALAAKEECAAFPLVLLLLDLSRAPASALRRSWPPLAAMAGLSLAAGLRVVAVLASVAQPTAGFTGPVRWSDYLAAQGWVILRYLRLLVIPWGFSFDPDIRVAPWQVALGWLGVAAIALLAARRFRGLDRGFWVLAGLVVLLPSSSIFPAEDFAADRRMYLPLAMLACAAALAIERIDWRIPAAAVVLLAALGMARGQVWSTERSLWEEAARMAPRKLRPKLQLARASSPSRALDLLRDAKLLAPDDPRVASQLGRVWLELRRPDMALAEFGRALALAPRDAQSYNNRAVALLALGQREAALADLGRALALDPCLEEARSNFTAVSAAAPPPCPRTP